MELGDYIRELGELHHEAPVRTLKKLEQLKNAANSRASKEVLDKAIKTTRWAVQNYVDNLNSTRSYLKSAYDSVGALGDVADRFQEVPLLSNPTDGIVVDPKFITALREFARVHQHRLKWKEVADAHLRLSAELMNELMRPSRKVFHLASVKEQILGAVKKIDIFSILDDLDSLPRLDPQRRMTEDLATGDRTIQWLEEYSDALLMWIRTAYAFRTRIEIDAERILPG